MPTYLTRLWEQVWSWQVGLKKSMWIADGFQSKQNLLLQNNSLQLFWRLLQPSPGDGTQMGLLWSHKH